MMIGDQHAHSERVRSLDTVDARDAVVHRDQDVRILELFRERDNFRRQPVAVFEAIGHQVIDHGAEFAQRAHADRARGCTVGIVVGDDQQFLFDGDRIGQELRHALYIAQSRERRKRARVGGQLQRRRNATRGKYLRKQRMKAGGRECRRGYRRCSAPGQLHKLFMRCRHKLIKDARGARTSAGRRA